MNLRAELKRSYRECCGCGACFNICPKQAISMVPDKDGFLVPAIDADLCVDCGLCTKACPVLNPVYKNGESKAFAMMAHDEIRKTSSSGGIFPLLAKNVLEKQGAVFGAAWTAEWSVEHIMIEDLQDLPKLQSSKYLQSNTKSTYRQAKQLLEEEREVLYSGTPCQIAGLYAYLGEKKYANLCTVEVCCHGVPSYKAFKKYLDENYDVNNIDRFDFRDKSQFGWIASVNVYFKDGTSTHTHVDKDPFLRAFNPCLLMRNSCQSCPFSRMPRQADITIGDFWGIDRVDKSLNDKKGTSFVLINNERGADAIDQIKTEIKMEKSVSLDDITYINKTLLYPFRQHPGRKHFYSSIDLKPFNELVEKSLNHHYDVGVVGLWYGINYGSVLTYFALYTLLRSLGYDAVMLPKPNNMWTREFEDPDSLGQRFIWDHCNVFAPFENQYEYIEANNLCDTFVVGSDVVWNYDICGRETDQFFFLDWVNSGHKKIAYAASMGNGLAGPNEYVEKAKHYLRQFDAISIREKTSADAAKLYCDRDDIVSVIDPVFLVSDSVYEKVIDEAVISESGPFVFGYLLRRDTAEGKLNILEYLSGQKGFAIKICANPVSYDKWKTAYGDRLLPELSVQEWLYYIKNCDFYVGDSYHGLCFSLIFQKPFLIIYEKNDYSYSGARFSNLLKLVGLENRLIEDVNDREKWTKAIDEPIDWESVNRKLAGIKEFSLDWLCSAMSAPASAPGPFEYLEDQKRIDKAKLQSAAMRNEVIVAELKAVFDILKTELAAQKNLLKSQSALIEKQKKELQKQINGTRVTVKAKRAVKKVINKLNG